MLADASSARTSSIPTGVWDCDRLALDNGHTAAAKAAQIKTTIWSVRVMCIITRFFVMLAALLCLTQVTLAADVTVLNAKARASLTPTATTGAVYFSVMNKGAADDRLLSISTPAAAMAMIHETTMVNDVMKMRMVDGGWNIKAGTTTEMKAGGTHVMLMGLKAPLKTGDTLAMELVFEKAGVVRLDVPVGGVAE
jgi:periplasmic copper chaperone A